MTDALKWGLVRGLLWSVTVLIPAPSFWLGQQIAYALRGYQITLSYPGG